MIRNFIYYFICVLFLWIVSPCFFNQCLAGQQSGRFFLMGSGLLHLKNLRNGQEARVHLLNQDGSFDERAFEEVDRVFGFPTQEKEEHISPRLLFMLSYFVDRVAPGKLVTIESGYRSPGYNNKIREQGANAAKTSTHMDGMALDFWLEDVAGKDLWETVRAKNCGGVGHYGGKTIHLDAGRPRFWEAATSGAKSTEPDYNRHVYLSTDFDRYSQKDIIRLSLSGIGTFGFGVRPTVQVYGPVDASQPVAQLRLASPNASDCIMISDRKTSRFLYASLPSELPAGRYKVTIEFCERPFVQMPLNISSNEIELIK